MQLLLAGTREELTWHHLVIPHIHCSAYQHQYDAIHETIESTTCVVDKKWKTKQMCCDNLKPQLLQTVKIIIKVS
jgi:hypothetical protein